MNQPQNHPTSAVEQVFEQPKKHVWDPERATKVDPIAIRQELERHVHMAVQANLHPIIASHMGAFPNEHSLFLDVDAGEGNLAKAVKDQFSSRVVLASEHHPDLRKLQNHTGEATIRTGHIQTLMHAHSVNNMQPACIHLGALPFAKQTRQRELVLRWAMDTVHDQGIITMFMEDDDETDICSQAKIQALAEVPKMGNIAYVAQMAEKEQFAMRHCRVPLEMQTRGLSQECFLATLKAVVPVEKYVRVGPALQMFRGFCEKQNAFRYNTRLVVLYSNPAMAPGSAPVLPEVASDAPARVVGVQGDSHEAVRTVIAPVIAKEMPVSIDIVRWLNGITHGSKHKKRFRRMTRDWKDGDAAKKTEMETEIRAELLKKCGVAKAELEQYFTAIMGHFAPTPVASQVASANVLTSAPVQPVAASAPPKSESILQTTDFTSPLPLGTATVGQVLARMEHLSSDACGGGVGTAFDQALKVAGWSKSDWMLLNDCWKSLESAEGNALVLPFLVKTSARPAPRSAATVLSKASNTVVPATKKQELSPEEAQEMTSLRALLEKNLPEPGVGRVQLEEKFHKAFVALMRLWKKQGGTYASLEASMSRPIPSNASYFAYQAKWKDVSTSDLTKEALASVEIPPSVQATKAELGLPIASNVQGVPTAENVALLGEGTWGELPPFVRSQLVSWVGEYKRLRDAGSHHHYSTAELSLLVRMVRCAREYGYGFTDVESLTGVSHPTLVKALQTDTSPHLTSAEQEAYQALMQELQHDLPNKGEAKRVDVPSAAQGKLVSLIRLWMKQGRDMNALVEHAPFALPKYVSLKGIIDAHRGMSTHELAPHLFPQAEAAHVSPVSITSVPTADVIAASIAHDEHAVAPQENPVAVVGDEELLVVSAEAGAQSEVEQQPEESVASLQTQVRELCKRIRVLEEENAQLRQGAYAATALKQLPSMSPSSDGQKLEHVSAEEAPGVVIHDASGIRTITGTSRSDILVVVIRPNGQVSDIVEK